MSSAAQVLLEAAYAIHHKIIQYQSQTKSPEPSSKESEFSQPESDTKTLIPINNCFVFREYENKEGGVLETTQKLLKEALAAFEVLDEQLRFVQLNIENTNSELKLLKTQKFNATYDTTMALAQVSQKIREMDLTESTLIKPQSSLENLRKVTGELDEKIAQKEKIKKDFEEKESALSVKHESAKKQVKKFLEDYDQLIQTAQVDLVNKKEQFKAIIATESEMVNN